ncbi:MAG TPA: SRPBCC family protein [Paracoccaceae bacterium]
MTTPGTHHSQFTLTRDFPQPPARVYAAWADPALKRRWFVEMDSPDWQTLDYALDFRVGGQETGSFRHHGAQVHSNVTVYLEIQPDQRILFAYTMAMDGRIHSASLATVEFLPGASGGTRMRFTEQGAYLDGFEPEGARQSGWEAILDNLGKALAG